jgi:transposase InsO family protein
MPGKRITDHQVHKFKQYRKTLSQTAAAAKVGISERSARRVERSEVLPSQRPERQWRTRPDPLADVWDAEVVPLLQADPQLNGVTLFDELQRRHPGAFAPGVLRTLQRRIRQWRVVYGPEREVYFAQEHPPGHMALSDFTVADDLQIVIGEQAFPHLIYQFALAHSGWRHAQVIVGGESFVSLSNAMQMALWRLGGVPAEHRTDSLSAAFKNLTKEVVDDITRRYEDLCAHYGMTASRCNPGQSHENGSVESRHGSLKVALDQALRLRGSRQFDDQQAYEDFIQVVVNRMNQRVSKAARAEIAILNPLPLRKTSEYEELPARVSKYSVFTIRKALYSAPSQLIGHRILVRQYPSHIEVWQGGQCIIKRPKAVLRPGRTRPSHIDYRDLVGALKMKPGAFARWTLRDEAFPRDVYRLTWERLSQRCPERHACKTIVGLLDLAAQGYEAQLGALLQQLIDQDELPELKDLAERLKPAATAVPEVNIELPELAEYDYLLEATV